MTRTQHPSHPSPQQPVPQPRNGYDEDLLLAAYAAHFYRGEDTSPPVFDWRPWAEDAGLDEREALAVLRCLAQQRVFAYADAEGRQIRLTLAGVFKAEKSILAEPAFVARQRGMRRRILEALAQIRSVEGTCPQRTQSWLATELGEPIGDVAANIHILVELNFLAEMETEQGIELEVTDDGLHTFGNGWGWAWPLN